MRDRLLYIVRTEGMSNLQFANEIGISPAAVTHILSGRNNPSLDIIAKIASRYPQYNLRWLILGEGETFAPTSIAAVNPVAQEPQTNHQSTSVAIDAETNQVALEAKSPQPAPELHTEPQQAANQTTPPNDMPATTTRLIVCFPDNTFTEYTARIDK